MRPTFKRTKLLVATALLVCSCWTVSAAGYAYGDKGGEIPAIQKKLIAAGYHARLNGEYDANTKWAVRLFQKAKGLPVDGVVGPATYKALMGRAMKASDLKNVGRMDSSKIAAEMKASRKAAASSSVGGIHLDPIGSDFTFAPNGPVPREVRDILTNAESYEGVPYVFGGTTPSGFDCSGYVRYVFAKSGISLPRMADEQYNVGTTVAKRNLQPGDLVFFQTYEPGVSHSGIYIGGGKFISATSSRGVAIADLNDDYWGARYIGAKRVL